MKHQTMRHGQTTTPGTTCPTLFNKIHLLELLPDKFILPKALKITQNRPKLELIAYRSGHIV